MEANNQIREGESTNAFLDRIVYQSELYKSLNEGFLAMKQQIAEEKDGAAMLKINDDIAMKMERKKRLRTLSADIYDTFRSIQFHSERLEKAWSHFLRGEFSEMDDTLDDVQAREEVKSVREEHGQKDKDWRDKAYVILRSRSYELVIKAIYHRTLVDLPNWKEESHALFRDAYNVSGNIHTVYELGNYLRGIEQTEEATKMLDDAYELAAELEEDYCMLYQAKALCVRGYVAEDKKEFPAAIKYTQRSAQLYQKLYERHPEDYRCHRVDIMGLIGGLQIAAGNYAAAASVMEEAVNIRRQMVQFGDLESVIDLAEAIDKQAAAHFGLGEHEEAIALYEESLRIKNDHLEEDPYIVLESKTDTLEEFIKVYLKREEYEKALALADEKMQSHRRMQEVDPYGEALKVIETAEVLCDIYLKLDRPQDAARERESQVEIYKLISEQCPGEETLHALGEILFQLATLYTYESLADNFLKTMKESLKVFRQLMSMNPESDEYRMKTGFLLNYIARCYEVMRERTKMRVAALESSRLLSSVPKTKEIEGMLKEMRRIIVTRW
jgi:tetratricopeptide (TPR) repeat protein